MHITKLTTLALLLSLLCSCAREGKIELKRYTFTREFKAGSNQAPRGGTTRGTKVELLKNDSTAWKLLQQGGISKKEQDRRAILAMAGDYRASFEFIETIPFAADYTMDRPYHSWATEKIFVLKDNADFISLQHLMVMFFVKDGKTIGPSVIKHWRQDWRYQPRSFHVFKGEGKWQRRSTTKKERKGAWVQEVLHVDDSPRYASIGRWEHNGSFSSWTGDKTFRPLPRREYSVRSDYDVLEAINRHVITPRGWVHEQENLKRVRSSDQTYIAKELGHNSYDQILGFDFSDGDAYWDKSKHYWAAVRAEWDRIYLENDSFIFKGKVENQSLLWRHFRFADSLSPEDSDRDFEKTVREFIAPHISK